MLAAVLGVVALAATGGGGCTEKCHWYEFLGLKGYGCVTGAQGTQCMSWGNTCAIMTNCRFTAVQRGDGTTLALRWLCPGGSRS